MSKTKTSTLARRATTTPVVRADVGADWRQIATDWTLNMKSERTRKAYLDAWRHFLEFARKSPADVNQSDVIAYKTFLKTTPSPYTHKPYSESTINQRLSALSSFFTYAMHRGLVVVNPVDGVTRESVTPYGRATALDVETDEDIAFIAQIDPTTPQGKRDRAIMLLYMAGAFRVSEVARLTVGSLRRQGSRAFLTYMRKGGEVEEVDIAPEIADLIEDYLATRDALTQDSPLFVATERGRRAAAKRWEAHGKYSGEEQAITPRAIRYLVRTYATRLLGEDGRRIHPHSLRHTAAQRADKEGLTFREISRLLKHKNPNITAIYMQATNKGDRKTARVMASVYT